MTFPKIELHVHLEGTVRAGTLLRIARRNDVALPADSVEGLAELYRFRDFAHFLQAWLVTTRALRTEQDFRQVVVDYAAEDPALVAELADRRVVLDVCPISNLRTGAVTALSEHPLPRLAGPAWPARCPPTTRRCSEPT